MYALQRPIQHGKFKCKSIVTQEMEEAFTREVLTQSNPLINYLSIKSYYVKAVHVDAFEAVDAKRML